MSLPQPLVPKAGATSLFLVPVAERLDWAAGEKLTISFGRSEKMIGQSADARIATHILVHNDPKFSCDARYRGENRLKPGPSRSEKTG